MKTRKLVVTLKYRSLASLGRVAGQRFRFLIGGLLLTALVGLSCSGPVSLVGFLSPTATVAPSATSLPSGTPTFTLTASLTLTPTSTATATPTPTITLTPPPSLTPTQSASPTAAVPYVVTQMQAFCRYGPGKVYLYSHGLYAGDRAEVHGRNYSGSWLWIQPENLERHCWASASVFEVFGEVKSAPVVQTRLPQATLYGPPEAVWAERDGDEVTVAWEPVWMTEDDFRGYLIEASICQGGRLVWLAVQTDKPRYTFTDERGCNGASEGRLFAVEKHGYTTPVPIPWP